MHSRTITLRPGESFVTADGVNVEVRTSEQEGHEQAVPDAIRKAHLETVAAMARTDDVLPGTTESLASLRWRQAAFVARAAPSAQRAPVAPPPAPDLCPKAPLSSSSRWLLGSFAAAVLALVLARPVAPKGSA